MAFVFNPFTGKFDAVVKQHEKLSDMPDTAGTNTDHDARYRQKCDNVLVVDPSGCADYTTIQAALDGNTSGGEVFIINPGTYTDDTIHFTANNQSIRGIGISPNTCKVTTANANIVDYAAYTGCRINRVKMEVTAATTLVHTVTGTTGGCNLVKCHTSMTTTYATAGAQPSVLHSSGASTVKVSEGTVEYNHTGSNAAVGKAVLLTDSGTASTTFELCSINVACSGASFVSGLSFGTGATEVYMDRCVYDIVDNGTAIVVGLYVAGAATGEFLYNDIHIKGTGALAIGLFLNAAGANIRSMYNHVHVEDATSNYAFYIGNYVSTIISQFDDVIAANGNFTGTGATLTAVASLSDGNLDITGTITANGRDVLRYCMGRR